MAGLGAILVCGVLTDRTVQSPGIWTVIPAAATVLIILSAADGDVAEDDGIPARHARSIAIGAVAYPLYLWHWPLLIFWLATIDDDSVGLAGGIVIMLVAGLLAVLTARCAQLPWRRGPGMRMVSGAVVLLVAVLLVATSLMWQGHVALASHERCGTRHAPDSRLSGRAGADRESSGREVAGPPECTGGR